MRDVEVLRCPYLGIYVNCFRVDAGDVDILIDSALASGRTLLYPRQNKTTVLLSTHGHWDHIGNHRYLQQNGVRVYAGEGDRRYFEDHDWHWHILFGQFEKDFDLPAARRTVFSEEIGEPCQIDEILHDGEILKLGNCTVKVIAVPGHSAGSLSFFIQETGALFTGDALMGDGFFSGIPQYTDSFAYRTSMEKLRKIVSSTVYCDHNDPMPGKLLSEKAEKSIACCERIEERVRYFTESYHDQPERLLAEAVKDVCQMEGKNPGGGACVTVLTHLKEMRSNIHTKVVLDTHITL